VPSVEARELTEADEACPAKSVIGERANKTSERAENNAGGRREPAFTKAELIIMRVCGPPAEALFREKFG
jgi:hypothetical protein